ncbi:ATP-binding protein [Lysobacter sp. BMK333-48F3]|uniref:AlbA family DNA-binding domain-containing protein n=1 Tax=Lysobacter sp. BMK333-48F3 TaxID=2867962 RepID=UPI001C8B77E3|nr:ATP-binding protein [Lysobacter sp. BMK333-48F3]MBX9400212.1 ATP-binding protein [Lysobacter sp. BMK333-48F3]
MDAAEWKRWIDDLIATGAAETSTLDFKAKPPNLKEPEARKEFLQDIAAFANARGGRIVYGIKEAKGIASQEVAFQENPDTIAQQMLAAVASIEPRITGAQFIPIQRQSGYMLIAEIPQQFTGPFLATMGNEQWFKIRNGLTRANMTHEQIRSAFGARAQTIANLRSWRRARLDELNRHIAGGRMAKVPWGVLHVMPIAAFASPTALDLTNTYPTYSRYPDSRYNLDGRLFQLGNDTRARRMQVFRNGVVETSWPAASKFEGTREGTILSKRAAQETWTGLRNAAATLKHWGLGGPVAVSLALLNASNTELHYEIDHPTKSHHAFVDDEAVFSEEFVDSSDALENGTGTVAKPLMDTLWQVYGLDECTYIAADGTWKLSLEHSTMA